MVHMDQALFLAAWLKTLHVLKLKTVGGRSGATSCSTSHPCQLGVVVEKRMVW
jgi:hypothetical protein